MSTAFRKIFYIASCILFFFDIQLLYKISVLRRIKMSKADLTLFKEKYNTSDYFVSVVESLFTKLVYSFSAAATGEVSVNPYP